MLSTLNCLGLQFRHRKCLLDACLEQPGVLHLSCVYEMLPLALLLLEMLFEWQQLLGRRPHSLSAAVEDDKELSASEQHPQPGLAGLRL